MEREYRSKATGLRTIKSIIKPGPIKFPAMEIKDGKMFISNYDIIGAEKQLNFFHDRLKADPAIRSYDY